VKISIIGSGYVGLVTGACFADLGHQVLCVDRDHEKIASLAAGRMPFFEPGLEDLVRINTAEGRLAFTESISAGVGHGMVIFIAVDTPSKDNGEADLSAVETVAREIAASMTDYRLVVEKSTVPVQTGEWVEKTMGSHIAPGVEFDVASNPEFLREGSAIDDFMRPDRVVIGTSSQRAASLLLQLYEPLNAPLLLTDIKSAELIKHCANAFLAMKISFINAVARICDHTGADVVKVAKGIGLDKRIGLEFLKAGIGFGGSCFPKDLDAFIKISDQLGYDFALLKEVQRINHEQRRLVIEKLTAALGDLSGRCIGILGLAFKADTDDLRNAPSLDIIRILLQAGARVQAHDPVAGDRAAELLEGISIQDDPYAVAAGADALVLMTDWSIYRSLNLERLHRSMTRPLVVDGRNLFDPNRMRNSGFEYFGIGR